MSGSTNLFELIPLTNAMARAFEAERRVAQVVIIGNPIDHTNDINTLLYGVHQETIPETKYLVLPDDVEISNFNANRHLACISHGRVQGEAAQGAVANKDAFHTLVRQLTHGIAAQAEVMVESNNIQERFFMPGQPRGRKVRQNQEDPPEYHQNDLESGSSKR